MAKMCLVFTANIFGLLFSAFCLNAAQSESNPGGQSCSDYEVCVDIGQCFTQFQTFADVAKHSCGRGKVFCRNKRNPCEIFQKNGLLYTTEDGKCHEPLVEGPCKPGQWLVTTNDGMHLS